MDVPTEFIPKVCIQSDWNNPTSSRSSSVWLSWYCHADEAGRHDNLQLTTSTLKQQLPICLHDDKALASTLLSKSMLCIHLKENNTEFILQAPSSTFRNIHGSASVLSLDISHGGELGVSSDSKERLLIWNAGTGEVMRTLTGHLASAPHLRFFPSGIVVLSGSEDMSIKIWSAEDASCPVTFVGHRGEITDTSFVDRGRNVVSCSRDGSSRLWDCSSSKCLAVLSQESSHATACSLAPLTSVGSNTQNIGNRHPDPLEASTDGKLLLVGHESGVVKAIDVYNRCEVSKIRCQSSVVGLDFFDEHRFVVICADGTLSLYDTLDISCPTRVFRLVKMRLLSHCVRDGRIFVGSGDGCCLSFDLMSPSAIGHVTSLTGADCDSINDVRAHNGTVYTACRDGNIRVYRSTALGRGS